MSRPDSNAREKAAVLAARLGETLPAYLLGRLSARIAADPADMAATRDLMDLCDAFVAAHGSYDENHPGPLFAPTPSKESTR